MINLATGVIEWLMQLLWQQFKSEMRNEVMMAA